MLRIAPWPMIASGPTLCSQINSPVRPSSACTMLPGLIEVDDAVVHDWASARWRPPSFIAHTQAMRSRPTLAGVICVSGLWLHAW